MSPDVVSAGPQENGKATDGSWQGGKRKATQSLFDELHGLVQHV